MDLKELFKTIKTRFLFFIIAAIVGAGIGVGAFFLIPKKHFAMGSLFIKRTIYPYAEDHFTYEGYYGQQAAVTYANSITGLIEGVDIQARSLKDLDIEINEENLRKVAKKIKVKRTGPQIVTIIVKENSQEKAHELWNAVAGNAIAIVNGISSTSDPYVGVIQISKDPIAREEYRNIWVCAVTGMGLGLLIALVVTSAKTYFCTNRKGKRG